MDHCCTICGSDHLQPQMDFGLNPPANRFARSELTSKEFFPLELGYCCNCDTIQLTKRMPVNEVKPRFPWLLYNEPEGHLDDAVNQICKLPGIGGHTSVLGLTYKDRSTVERFAKQGMTHHSCLSYTIFQDLDSFKQPLVDLCIARHVIEHASNATEFILQLKSFITPNGYLIIEIPDSEKLFKYGNHGFIWEEHISYFTEESLQILANQVNAKMVWFGRFPYRYEDALMAAFQFTPSSEQKRLNVATKSQELLAQFNQDFTATKTKWREALGRMRQQGHKLAMFGAGHLAVKWINFFQLGDLLDCVIDDHPEKVGMLMPGSKLPIYPSSALFERGIQICISTLSPESEKNVKRKLIKYFEEGGIFIPAFKAENNLFRKINEEVFATKEPVVRLDARAIEFVKEKAVFNARGRARICMHKAKEDNLHEMLIAIRLDSYIRPHHHPNKVESFHLIEGKADVILFNVDGQIIDIIKLSPNDHFYYRLDQPLFHTLIVQSPILVIHETTNGPFNIKDTEFASFSPPEEDSVAVLKYMNQIKQIAKS